jgi:hypothetical protein
VSPVPAFFTVTLAAGTAAPFGSCTTPVRLPVGPDWALAAVERVRLIPNSRSIRRSARRVVGRKRFIGSLLWS